MTDVDGGSTTAPTDAPESGGRSAFGIVLVNYGSHALVERAATALTPPSDVPLKIVIVDNFSTAAEQHAVQALGTANGWTVISMPDNRGFGAACNAGVTAAFGLGCDRFMLLNPDALVEPAVIVAIDEMLTSDNHAVVAPRIIDSAGAEVFAGARLNLRDGRIRSRRDPAIDRPEAAEELAAAGEWVPWLTGACVAMHRTLWDEIGGFREAFFLYWEDVDLTVRAFRAGGHLIVRHDLVALHDEGGTQGVRTGRAKSALYYDYNCRNRLRFAADTLSRGQILRWIAVSPAVSWEILMRGGRRQLVQSPKLLWAAVRGTGIGLALAVRSLVRRPADTRGEASLVAS